MTARKQFLLRVDPELWKQLEAWASDELRSVNSQVEFLLRDAVRKRPAATAPRHSIAAARSRWSTRCCPPPVRPRAPGSTGRSTGSSARRPGSTS
ncbi:MAG: hypothetical protein ABR941_08960 [Thermoleophilia bacterium]